MKVKRVHWRWRNIFTEFENYYCLKNRWYHMIFQLGRAIKLWNYLDKNRFVLNREGSKYASDEVDRWSERFVEPRSDRVNILSGFDFSRSLGKQKLSVSPVFCFIQESDGEVLHRRRNVGIHQRNGSFWQDTSAAWFKSQLVLQNIVRPYITKLNGHTYL